MNEPIRILHVVGNMGAGGLETLIMNWYRTIDREKIQFDFLVHKTGKAFYEDEIIALGGRVYHCSFLNDYNYISYRKFLREFFTMHREYKIVHGHHSALGPFYLKAAEKAGIPIRISHSHIADFSKSVRGVTKYLITRSFGKYANIHFACSNAAGKYMYGNKYNFEVINNGIDTKKFRYREEYRLEKRRELHVENKKVLLHVGRFHDQKNHSFLIEIFNTVHKLDNNFVLLMAGVGPLQEIIRSKVKELELENSCFFLDNRNDIYALLSAADVFVFPSLYEGLPLTLIEAQASGIQIICSNTITPETKLCERYISLSLMQNVNEWADSIIDSFSKKFDRSKAYITIRQHGFDNEDVVRKMSEFYLNSYELN